METAPRPRPVHVPAAHDGARPALRRGGQSGVRGASPLTARRPKEAAADWPRLQAVPGIRSGGFTTGARPALRRGGRPLHAVPGTRSGGLRQGPGPPCVAEVWPTGIDFSPLHYSQARGAATEGHRAYPRWARESSARATAAQRPRATPRPWRPAPPAPPCTTPLLTRPTLNHPHAQHYSLRAGCAVRAPFATAAALPIALPPGPLAPLPTGHPELPPRRARLEPTEPEARPRFTSGDVGLVRLGASRAVTIDGGRVVLGTFTAYHQPWYEVTLDGGGARKARAHEAMHMLLFDPADFAGRPELFYYDFNGGNPALVPGWCKGLTDYLEASDAVVPEGWLEPTELAAGGERGGGGGAADTFLATEREQLRLDWLDLAGSAWAPSTLQGLRNPALKALWFLASRGFSLPPPPLAVTNYLTWLAVNVDTTGAVEVARQAVNFLCTYNGWDPECVFSSRAAIPAAAMRRRHTRTSPRRPLGSRRSTCAPYCGRTPSSAPSCPGTSSGVWPSASRWALATRPSHVTTTSRAFAMTRATSSCMQCSCASSSTSARLTTRAACTSTLRALRTLSRSACTTHSSSGTAPFGGTGYVLPHVDAQGVVHRERPMSYDDYARHLRSALVTVGVPPAEAASFTPHSARPARPLRAPNNCARKSSASWPALRTHLGSWAI